MPGINIFTQAYPVIGLHIRKTVAQRDVYFRRGGYQYKRRYIIPPNPRTPAQQEWRGIFRQAVWAWHDLTSQQQNGYNTLASTRGGLTGFNFFVSHYLSDYGL